MTKIPNDKRSLPFGSAFAINDSETLSLLNRPLDLNCLTNDSIIEDFLNDYDSWIKSTKNNKIKGLEKFEFKCYSQGTTESFDKFYQRNHHKRFRCFHGEYMYHRLAWRDDYKWVWLEDDDLRENDAVILSLPFADTGDVHKDYDVVLKKCTNLEVPVLIDCAYFGICQDIEFNLDYDCITDITFSLSKTFPLAYARIGVRYTKIDTDDTLFVYHKINYNNKMGAALGLRFIEKFTPDYIPFKYKDKQLEFCRELRVIPSKTVLFGIGDDRWNEYNRGGFTNRLSFHRQFIKGL